MWAIAFTYSVMAGLGPAIHVLRQEK